MQSVTILYEDRLARGGNAKNYGPHIFVLHCLYDELGVTDYRARALLAEWIVPNPRAGNGNVWNDCRATRSRFGRDGGAVLVVFDADRVCELVQLSAGACKTRIKEKLLAPCPAPMQHRIVLLERNLETVLAAIVECDPRIATEEEKRRALEKRSSLNVRDIIFQKAAARSRVLRDSVLQKVPSLCYLVRKLADACLAQDLATRAP